MHARNGRESETGSFALVSYLSGPLAEFLDEVRLRFAPDSRAKAHVTLLPPRPLLSSPATAASSAEAWRQIKDRLHDFQPFQVELGTVEVFRESTVVYLSIESGFEELRRMHEVLNAGLVAFEEPFDYHPHVTIVQEVRPEEVRSAAAIARWRWSEFRHPRSFRVDRLTFVQNMIENGWTDLGALDLASQLTQ